MYMFLLSHMRFDTEHEFYVSLQNLIFFQIYIMKLIPRTVLQAAKPKNIGLKYTRACSHLWDLTQNMSLMFPFGVRQASCLSSYSPQQSFTSPIQHYEWF